MKKIILYSFTFLLAISFVACEKEYSLENSGQPSELIVGADCRISKIIYTDTASKKGLGFIEAEISNQNIVTRITRYDSLSNTIEFRSDPLITNDTIYIQPEEYFIVDVTTKLVNKLHGLTDPTDPFSPQFDIKYNYNASAYLTSKVYTYSSFPGIPVYTYNYIYTGGNLTQMAGIEELTGDTIINADLSYYNFIFPKRFLYLLPDDQQYNEYNQFYNFGTRSLNAVKKMTIRNFDPGNVLRDSLVSNFSNYIMSRDTYVQSVQMAGDDQPCIPARAGKLSFSYKCK